MAPGVFVFNPFAEGYIARGKAFTPVKHQAQLAADLANLPQFLGQSGDLVLLAHRPAAEFLRTLAQAGFALPEFIELHQGRLDPADPLLQPPLRALRPWAWGPDSVALLAPLFGRVAGGAGLLERCFNEGIAQLYSKAWSAAFLRNNLARFRGLAGTASHPHSPQTWLGSESDAGLAVDTVADALEAVAAIRRGGHHRVVVKAAYGLAGHNAIRLWEPEVLPAQRQWLARTLQDGGQLVVEPWLERVRDFSVQLEMGPRKLQLCGFTGLLNDRKGQFLANWAEPDYAWRLPTPVAAVFGPPGEKSSPIEDLYHEIIASLEAELHTVGFTGPISIDAFAYRTAQGSCRLKPVVEINPRYTMGRLTLELMKHAAPGSYGLFRLVTQPQARAAGFADLSSYARSLRARAPLRLDAGQPPRIRQGALCLNDPSLAQVCLATFEVSPTPNGLEPPGTAEPPPFFSACNP